MKGQETVPDAPAREGRTFANGDGNPFRSPGSEQTYTVRIAPDHTVWFDYQDGTTSAVQGVTEHRALAWADRGLWKRVR